MAHNIEIHADGTASFASARVDAWHRLGTITRDAMTAEEAMANAYLSGWNVRKLGLTATEISENGVTSLAVPDQFATARTNPKTGTTDVLGVVGERYEPVQNEEHCELLNTLVDESGAHFETAGSLHGGRQVFVTMRLPQTMHIAGTDAIDFYIAGCNSHDGSSAFRLLVTPTRIVCANTQSMALRDARTSYSIRHTAGAKGKIAEARKALGLVWKYAEEFEKAAERMINESLTVGEFEKVCGELWPADPNPSVRTRNNQDRRTTQLRYLFRDAATQSAIRGTRWAGVQAIGEYLDHYTPAKNDEARAHRVLTSGDLAGIKQRAYDLLSA
jgi:phage/plasmid-like protein (TIGR03299 family)